MGDHRASIKIEMEFHGVRDSRDMWLNYSPDGEYYGVDDRLVAFIRDVYERGMAAYAETMWEAQAEERHTRIEKQEQAELARLKAKYEHTPHG